MDEKWSRRFGQVDCPSSGVGKCGRCGGIRRWIADVGSYGGVLLAMRLDRRRRGRRCCLGVVDVGVVRVLYPGGSVWVGSACGTASVVDVGGYLILVLRTWGWCVFGICVGQRVVMGAVRCRWAGRAAWFACGSRGGVGARCC